MGNRFLDLVTTKYLVIPFLLVIPVSSFSTGSGEETCVTLRPNHDVHRPQTSPPPYTLEVSPTTFSPGQIITVTIVPEPNNLAAQTYRGISLQARRAGDSLLRAIGIWTIPNANFQYLNCLNSPQGTLTHTSAIDKTLPMTFQWTSPAGTSGNVFFSATIVQNFETFWVDFRSQMVQDITVQPDPPMITCPMDLEVALQPGTTGSNVNFMDPTCVDPSNGQSLAVICSPTSGSLFAAGSTSVSCFCTSLQQATATCTFTVTVGSPPLIFCPSVMAMAVQGNNMGAFVTFGQPVCIDPQGGQLQSTCNMPSGSFFSVPQTTVTCTCSNMDGIEATCDFVVTLTGINTAPAITCPPSEEVTSLFGTFGNLVSFSAPNCTDAESLQGALNVTCNPMSGSLFQIGSNTVTCTCTDEGGLADTCTLSVVVTDVNPPVILCPSDVTVQSTPNNGGNFATWPTPTCTDMETPNDVTVTCDPPSGSFFQNTGLNTVTCNCTDGSGSVSSCTLNVNIQAVNSPPMITCPQVEGVLSLSGNIGNVVNFPLPSCSDQQDVASLLTVTCSRQSGEFFVGTGTTPVLCTCTDTGLLSDQCTINVEIVAENIPPVIGNCPVAAIIVDSQPNDIGAVIAYTTPTCVDTDNGGTTPTVICDPAPGSFVQGIGNRVGTCTCSDLAGDTDQCTFTYIINAANTPPVIRCPPQVVVESLAGDIGNNAMWPEPSCTDAEQTSGLLVSCIPMTGSFFPGVGDNLVTCTCTDNGGLVDTCTFAVIIQEANTPPNINCPPSLVVESATTDVGNVADMVGVTCVDTGGNDATLSVTCTSTSNLVFGENIVNCECSDSAGLSDSCQFSVTIVAPNVAPIITCPADVTSKVAVGTVGTSVTFANPDCIDSDQNNQILATLCNPPSNSFFQVGVNTVTCTCNDINGATDTCTFTVTVSENNPPTITCPDSLTMSSLAGSVGNIVTYNTQCFDVEDNVGQLQTDCSMPSGSFFAGVGSTVVTCTCTDSCDFTDSCFFIVDIQGGNNVYIRVIVLLYHS